MTQTQKILVKAALASLLGAAVVFGLLMSFSKIPNFFHFEASSSLSDATPDPLPYESIGNFPPLEEGQTRIAHEKEFTLEIGSCETKTCITKTLQSLSKKGVEAFYTPSKEDGTLIFRIRRGIFTSRQSAERAQTTLNKEKKIKSLVVEL